MPNYFKLYSIDFIAKYFGWKDEDFKLTRWEVVSDDSDSGDLLAATVTFKFDFEKEEVVTIKYVSLHDIMQAIGGIYTSVIASVTGFYGLFFGWSLTSGFTKRLKKGADNENLKKLYEMSGKEMVAEKIENNEELEDLVKA